ncbi:hypothetical protein TL16_g03805 [Triparma laevis f. inornata]|uniref:Leucine-rich repeat domain-containing protein n=1 Tax=Triparma laevis f. inornata TaxID=1714386 RepID=A0A9W7A6Y9_9STRA|nr:hypothetical protein TL16_g03805 [Triparma laevis f. inornata]
MDSFVFHECFKLVPSSIDVNIWGNDTTPEVVAHLRSEMSLNALLSGNNFLNTDDFRRLIAPYLLNDALMTIRLASKPWSRVADDFISDGVESRAMIVRGEAVDFVVVEIPEGVKSIGKRAFQLCTSLTTVSFPTTLTSIGELAFQQCSRLENVDLLHANLQELGQ